MSFFGQSNGLSGSSGSSGTGRINPATGGVSESLQMGNRSDAGAIPSSGNVSSTIPSSNAHTSSRLLQDLLESANNLPKPNNSDLGSIHLTLNGLKKKSNQLRKRNDNEGQNFTKAHYLLASSGVSAEEIENELNSIEVPVKPLESQTVSNAVNNNIDSYLNDKKDENILAAIEQSLVSASKDFNQFINENVSIDWKVRRDELRKSFGIGGPQKNTSHKVSKPTKSVTWNKSIPGNYNVLAPLSTHKSTSFLKNLTREKFENNAQIVYQLNEARLNNSFFPIALSFEELNRSYSDLKSKQISEAWKILIELTNEKTNKINQEQKFFETYQTTDHTNSMKFRKQVIQRSKNYLEQQFYNYMDEIYTKDDKKKQFSTSINIDKVSYFIDKIIMKNNTGFVDQTLNVNGVPIWALIFYLLRSGLYKDALELASQNKDLFNKFDKNFPVYIKKFVENDCINLPMELNERLNAEFNQQFAFINDDLKGNFDPFKYSVYKLIGKCDLSKKKLPDEINLSIEDWLWFHLSIINEFNFDLNSSSLIFENYSLENLQKKVIQLGPKKFNSSSNNPLYLKTLIMVGLYELAVEYAFDLINECDAVHLAIGLCYYGLLKVSSLNNKDELIFINSSNEYEINFSRLLGSYTRFFKISDPMVACQYLILIAMSKGGDSKEEISKCHEALRELILISREFNMLLGELNQNNGNKIPGILEKQRSLINLSNLEQFQKQIIETSAIRCEEEGRIFDALLLYQLCQDFDTVVSLINKLLGETLSTTELDKPLINYGNYENINGEIQSENTIDNNIILLSQHIMKLFYNNSFILDRISPSKKETCDLLLPIIHIRDLFMNKNWNDVIIEINKLGLLPVNQSNGLIEIRKMAEFVHNTLDDHLIKVIPSLLIMVMTSVSQLNYSILTKRYQTSSNEREELSNLKTIAKNCMIYAGMVQYKMPRETYSLLISLESLL